MAGCGGTSAGTCTTECTTIAKWPSGGSTTDLRYYTAECSVAACTSCTIGNYNNACPAQNNALSTSVGSCSPCSPAAPVNGAFVKVTTGITNAASCPWACNAGFYATATACPACPFSDTCTTKGYYKPMCSTATINPACVSCGQALNPYGAGTEWITSNASYGVVACNYQCSINYYWETTACVACSAVSTAMCAAGTYVTYPCTSKAGMDTRPKCVDCTPLDNAVAAPSGTANKCMWTCDSGYYWSAAACVKWTVVACVDGQYAVTGTALVDSSCAACSGNPTTLKAYSYYTAPCVWACRAGAYQRADGQCMNCDGGYYKPLAGSAACTQCSSTQYQQSKSLPTACDSPPANAVVNADRIYFSCLQGFKFDVATSTCGACPATVFSLVNYTINTCTVTAFSCASGKYRVTLGCTDCVAPSSNAATLTAASTTAAVIALGALAAASSDESNFACPAPATCNAGYYYQSFATASIKSYTARCTLCTAVTCPAGQFLTLCTGTALANTCGTCDPTKLPVGSVWTTNCATQCAKGYYGTTTCTVCAAGRFKALDGPSAACDLCPTTTFSAGTGSWACSPCPVGTFGSTTGLTVCGPCAAGLSSVSGVSACVGAYDLTALVTDNGGLYKIRSVNVRTAAVTTLLTPNGQVTGLASTQEYLLYTTASSAVYKYTFGTAISALIAGHAYLTGYVDGSVGVSRLSSAKGIAIASDGSFALICDGNIIRKLDLNTNYLSKIAGTYLLAGYRDGTDCTFYAASGISIASDKTFAVLTEISGNRVRKLDLTTSPVTCSLLGGNTNAAGLTGSTAGVGASSRFTSPKHIALSSDNFWAFVTDANNVVRIIQVPTMYTETLLNSGITSPYGIAVSPSRDYLMVASQTAHKVYKISFPNAGIGYPTSALAVYAGSSSASENDGVGSSATFNSPSIIAILPCSLRGYGAVTAANQCAQCLAGAYGIGNGICYLCPPGSANSILGASACLPCAINFFSGSGASACTPCAVGSQVPSTGATACLSLVGYYVSTLSNLVKGKTAFASSVYSASYPASNGNDGSTANIFHSLCSNAAGSWWGVDLGTVRTVSGGIVWSRADSYPDRLNDFQIWVGSSALAGAWATTGLTWCFTDFKHTQGLANGNSQSFACASPIAGRYAYLYRPSTDCINLAEIQLRESIVTACAAGTFLATANAMTPVELTYSSTIYSLNGSYGGLPAYGGGGLLLYSMGAAGWAYTYTERGLGTLLGSWAVVAPSPATLQGLVDAATNVKYCSTCATGFYAAASAQSACVVCPFDFYCSTTAATACPVATPYTATVGTVLASGCRATLVPVAGVCRAGFFISSLNAAVCRPCLGSAYCAANIITACSPVNTGLWYAPPLATKAADCVYKAVAGTVTCPANSVKATASVAVTDLWQCRAAAGYYLIPSQAATICPSGYYCPAGALMPIACPVATCTTPGFSQVANTCPQGSAAQLSACQACPALPANAAFSTGCSYCCNVNFLMIVTACVALQSSAACSSSTLYMPDPPTNRCAATAVQACVACPILAAPNIALTSNQTYRLQNAVRLWGTDACVYVCPPGYLLSLKTCVACPVATYQLGLKCEPCPSGTFMSASAASGGCWSCGPYGYPNAAQTGCVCVGGAYVGVNSLNRPECIACTLGSITQGASCVQCTAGTVIKPNVNASGSACGSIDLFRANANSTCMSCPPTSAVVAGQRCSLCPPGTYRVSATRCEPCPANTYSAGAGSSVCTACSPPFVSPLGSVLCMCPANFYMYAFAICVACRKTCAEGASLLQGCPMGSVSDVSVCACPERGETTCTACPIPGLCGCPRNFFNNGTGCKPCRAVCPKRAILSGVCEKGTAPLDTTECTCPALTFWMGSDCQRCRVCAPNATYTSTCASGSTQDTTQCVCNAGFRGNGVTSCQPF